MDMPVCALFVQNAVTAFLATDGVAALEGDFGVAITAEVGNRAVSIFHSSSVVAGLESSVSRVLLGHFCDRTDGGWWGGRRRENSM